MTKLKKVRFSKKYEIEKTLEQNVSSRCDDGGCEGSYDGVGGW